MQNEELITKLYNAFKEKDALTMTECYHPEAIFQDPAFGKLQGKEVPAMWQILIETGGDNLEMSYKNISSNSDAASAEWSAHYLFGKSKRPVTNHIKASFLFKNGLIIQHTDQFDLWKWSRQAMGTSGLLLGWTSWFKKKVQARSKSLLKDYIAKSS